MNIIRFIQFLFVILIFNSMSYSQSLKVKYQQQFENGSVKFDEIYDLIITDTISAYIERDKIGKHGLKGSEDGEVFLFEKNKKLHRKYYLNFKDKFLFSEEYYGEQLLIRETDSLLNKKWTYIDSTKVINQYKCKLAKKEFRGRTYNVWYTTDIPIDYGPWKLYGLPGLILEAYDNKNEFSIIALELSSLTSEEKQELIESNILKDYLKQKVYSIDEFQNKLAEHRQIILNRISNSLPRNAANNLNIGCEDCDEGLENY